MDNYIFAEYSDTGKMRAVNEDCMASFDSPNGHVIVVCDGMGGQNAGDVASQLAVAVIKDILTDNTFATAEEAITRSVIAANQAILKRASVDNNLSGMGSTCVILIIKDGVVTYGSVGDSRIYYLTDNSIKQLTRDQSYVQSLVDAGEITEEEASKHQDKNQITNALGIESMTPPVINPIPVTAEPGGIFLLCSDGLTNMVKDADIHDVLTNREISLQQRAERLVSAANAAGGLDNITVQLVEIPQGTDAVSASYDGSKDSNGIDKVIKRNRMMTYLLGALAVLILIGGGITFFYNRGKSEPEPVVIEHKTKSSKRVVVKPATVKKEVVVVEKTTTTTKKTTPKVKDKVGKVMESAEKKPKGKKPSNSVSNTEDPGGIIKIVNNSKEKE